jgi:hypothetical protein
MLITKLQRGAYADFAINHRKGSANRRRSQINVSLRFGIGHFLSRRDHDRCHEQPSKEEPLLDRQLLSLSDVPGEDNAGQITAYVARQPHIANRRLIYHKREEGPMQEQCAPTISLRLDERESAQLAYAVEKLVLELGFPLEDVNRSYQDSYAFFLKNPS